MEGDTIGALARAAAVNVETVRYYQRRGLLREPERPGGEDRARVRALAEARLAALDQRIAELEKARTSLRQLARQCSAGSAGACPILTAFERG